MWLRSPLFSEAGDAGAGGGGAAGGGSGDAGQGSRQAAPWFSSLSVPAEHVPFVSQFKDPLAFIEGAKTAHTTARQKTEGMIKMPGQDAKPEDIDAFHKALGVPEKPDGYGFKPDTKPEGWKDGIDWNEDLGKEYSTFAHGLGLTPAQAAKLPGLHLAVIEREAAAQVAQRQAMIESEKKAIADAFGEKVDSVVSTAAALVAGKGIDPETMNPKSDKFWGPEALKLVAAFAQDLGPTKLSELSAPGRANGLMTPGQQANDIITNPNNPDYQRYYSGDAGVNDRVNQLLEQEEKRKAA